MFESNNKNEIFFVDGAETELPDFFCDALTSASAHFLDIFKVNHEVDVYISKRSILHKMSSAARAWHYPPAYDREHSVVCVYVDSDSKIETMIQSLAHEFIHVWQVERGDLVGQLWKGRDLSTLPYHLQPWEIEAHASMDRVANTFFNASTLSTHEKNEIISNTDRVFKEIEKTARFEINKTKVASILKIAGAVGLGALIGA
jgi:hypothetical protein